MSELPTPDEPSKPAPNQPDPNQLAPNKLALWFPVVVSGLAVIVWLSILAWMAYR